MQSAECELVNFKFVDPLKDKKLASTSSILQYNNIVESQCVINCAADTKCGSVNYHKEAQICILNGKIIVDEKNLRLFKIRKLIFVNEHRN